MGMINKSGIGNDSLFLVERIIGAAGQFNAINAAPAFGGASILVDLQNNFLRVRDIPTLGNRDFTVQNFMEVIGTVSNDSITGNNSINFLAGFDGDDFLSGLGGDDILFGDEGNDFLTGGSGNDFLRATDEFARGFAEFDDMQGGTGSDIFVLGDCDGAFYNSNGEFDDALILDFSAEDSLELGLGEVYRAVGRTGGFNLFTVNSFGLELIAQVDTTSAIALPTGNFSLLSGQRLGVFFGA
jgi:Ca2+-binding RTX toxin-like protein